VLEDFTTLPKRSMLKNRRKQQTKIETDVGESLQQDTERTSKQKTEKNFYR
jgi:hypothetical protein